MAKNNWDSNESDPIDLDPIDFVLHKFKAPEFSFPMLRQHLQLLFHLKAFVRKRLTFSKMLHFLRQPIIIYSPGSVDAERIGPPHSCAASRLAGRQSELEGLVLKVILSRKGFDSSWGGHASPILPDGKMLSLPIPKDKDTLRYDEIAAPDGKTYGGIIDELAAGAHIAGMGAHLDPDLVRGARPRLKGWRPALGHTKASTHLQNEGVSVGDLFLFFGWFRHTEEGDDGLRFRRGNKGYHVIFGYLQIGEILTAPAHSDLPPWLRDHPHAVSSRVADAKNTIYVAMQKLSLHPNYPGAGIFQFDKQNVLTKEGLSRSRWNLDPELFQNVRISCHSQTAWRDEFFQSNRGQEFVIDANKPIVAWASRLIRNSRLWELD